MEKNVDKQLEKLLEIDFVHKEWRRLLSDPVTKKYFSDNGKMLSFLEKCISLAIILEQEYKHPLKCINIIKDELMLNDELVDMPFEAQNVLQALPDFIDGINTLAIMGVEPNHYLYDKLPEIPASDMAQLRNRIHDIMLIFNDKNNPIAANNFESQFRIAQEKKTDFIKIISAMYELHLFEKKDGKIASNKQKLFDSVGIMFDEDFSKYSTFLSNAKNASNFLDVFDKLKEKANSYYSDDKNSKK